MTSTTTEGLHPAQSPPDSQEVAAPKPARRRRRGEGGVAPYLLGALGIVVVLGIWELVALLKLVNPVHLPPPTVVLPVFFSNFGLTAFWQTIGHTMWAWLLGLTVATVAGLLVGLAIGSSSFLNRYTHTTVEFLRPIPAVGLIPVAALIFGPRFGAEFSIVAFGCFWIVLIQVIYGILDVDKVAMDTTRTMGMSFAQRARHLVLPSIMPYLMTGIRLAATVAFILAVSVELIIGTPGLGRSVAQAQLNDNPPAMYALVLTTGCVGIIVNLVFRGVEKKVLFWHASVRSEATS